MITSLVGRADHYNLIFTLGDDGFWRTVVPADLSDGQYVVELYAHADSGKLGYWTGILYLNRAWEICARIIDEDLSIWLAPDDIDPAVDGDRLVFTITCLDIDVSVSDDIVAELADVDEIAVDTDDITITLGRCGNA